MTAHLRKPETSLMQTIAKKVGTPLYVYDAAVLRARLSALQHALPGIDFFYSMKANPNLSVTRVLRQSGAGCEVSSMLELETAVLAGATPDRILMVGPGKSSEELARAVALGIKSIVVESLDELREIDRLAAMQGKVQSVAIRVNPDFQTAGARLTMSGRATQFGIDQAEAPQAFALAQQLPCISLCGLHTYMGTRILSHHTIEANIRNILSLAAELGKGLPAPLAFVDVGGGFGVPYAEDEVELDLRALGHAVAPALASFAQSHPQTKVVVELGRYLVAPAGQFITTIRQIKTSKGERFAVCDGGSNVHSAAAGQGSFLRKNFPINHLRNQSNSSPEVLAWTLTGPLCTPQDVIGKSVMLAGPMPGDLICIQQSGAYGPTASPVNFLGFGPPAEVMLEGETVQIVRRRDTIAALLRMQEPQSVQLGTTVTTRAYPARSVQGADDRDVHPAFCHPALDRLKDLEPLFHATGAQLDADPEAWRGLWENAQVRALTTIGVPEEFNGFPLAATDLGIDRCDYGLHVAMVERLARFDANCILSLPGPSLSGGAVLAAGNPAQVARFFGAYQTGPQGTFFAVTEPDSGSDASNGRSTVTEKSGGLVLNGTKMLVGGAARAGIGLVFANIAHTGRSALVMIDPATAPECIQITRLATSGLRGADLCRINLQDFPVSAEMILGGDGRSLRDGFMGINGVFERNRPMVAALALGTARGILDLVQEGHRHEEIAALTLGHTALRRQLMQVVAAYEAGRPKAHEISMVKMQAVALADRVAEAVMTVLPQRFLQDSTLRRRCRDVKAFEYMEGTSNIHVLNAYRAYTAGVAR